MHAMSCHAIMLYHDVRAMLRLDTVRYAMRYCVVQCCRAVQLLPGRTDMRCCTVLCQCHITLCAAIRLSLEIG